MGKILITGAKGQLGCEMSHLLDKKGINHIDFDSHQLDITNNKLVKEIFLKVKPSIVFHCAAYTKADNAEYGNGKSLNWEVNNEGTKNIALACKKIGATLVYISSDYVFDGKCKEEYLTTDTPHPINEYGKAKLAGENFIKENLSKYYIIRTSWVFGKYGNNFVYTMLRLSNESRILNVVDDQKGRPTWAFNLANFMLFAVKENIPYGIYQFSNDGSCTWYEFSKEILKNKSIIITPVSSDDYPRRAARPQNSVMSLNKIKATGFSIPTWKEALRNFMIEIGEIKG